MRLSKEHIQFIDTYLKNSGIRYSDIRFEMTDHVAAALEETEGDFYENFRKYMVENKRELLLSNRIFKKLARRKAWNIIGKNFLKPQFWIIALTLFTMRFVLAPYFDEDEVRDILQITLLLASSFIYFYFLYYRLFRINLNSVIDKLLTIVYFGGVVFRLDKAVEHNTTLTAIYYSISIAFMILLIQSLWQINFKYKLRYDG